MRGVRIQLQTPIFKFYKVGKNEKSLISEYEVIDETRSIFILPHLEPLYKIEYTEDYSKLKPPIQQKGGLYLLDIGTCKKTIWTIENEWRYRINIIPIDPDIRSNNFSDKYNHLITKKQPPSISFFDLPIDRNVFESMRILTGPKLKSGDKEIIEALIDKYNYSAKLEMSSLSGFIQ